MKKSICIFVGLGLIFSIFLSGISVKSGNTEDDTSLQSSIEDKLIRFHVIANSDKAEDQALKLKVRDKVLEYIAPKLRDSSNIEESRNILKQNDRSINEIAQEIIKENGFSYNVVTMLTKENFPVKTYGNITLPQGEYEAYRIIIGSGKGQNWWCVMFPPLCFIDITKGEVSYKETEKAMKQVLSAKEYEEVDNTNSILNKNIVKSEEASTEKIEIRFKIFDEIKKLFS
jgi:stage II sporulation protein R